VALRKRMSRKDLQKTDPVTAALEEFVAKMMKYRRPLILAGVALVAVLVAAVGYRRWSDTKVTDRAEAVSAVFAVLGSTVGAAPAEEQEADERRLNFPDEAARRAALEEKVGAVASGYAGSRLGALARMIAPIEDPQGSDMNALRGDSAFLLEGEPALAEWLQLNLGRAAWTSGDHDAAALDFEALATDENRSIPARTLARVHAGDLQNPAFGGKDAPDKAREAYRTALRLIDTSIQSRSGAFKNLRGEVAVRLALLPDGASEPLAPVAPSKTDADGDPAQTASP
jgi:hypothetical protein